MSSELHYLTIAEAAGRIRAGTLSPVALTEAYLARIDALDGMLHSYIRVLAPEALAEARKADAEIKAGHWKGPLHGIPLGIKDIYNTAGVATTGHSALFRDHIPAEDATSVRLLREAGAIMLGKLSTFEFAIGGPSFDLPWPPARNPWNLECQPGGSSSGSGAAVAAGLCAGAMGSDTGGSIRYPAAWCGIAGIKPTYGLVSRKGVLPLAYSLDHAGPMCWTAEDCALMLQALAGHDPADPASANVPIPDYAAALGGGLAGLRVGLVRHFYEADAPSGTETIAALEQVAGTLSRLGATVADITIAPFAAYGDLCMLIMEAEAFAIHEQHLVATPELYGALARRRIMSGAMVRATDYINAQRMRAKLTAELVAKMHDVDVLLMPTWGEPAAEFGEEASLRLDVAFTMPFNVTGNPALSVCSGFSADGLPLSAQIVGRHFEDALVLKVGDAFEKAAGLRDRRPDLAFRQAA
jgi:aspartyl-tRNA(Asn)/glutamyl-tRNA(Gln) amidotransferase subunit A